jgi:hypothetical protein
VPQINERTPSKIMAGALLLSDMLQYYAFKFRK